MANVVNFGSSASASSETLECQSYPTPGLVSQTGSSGQAFVGMSMGRKAPRWGVDLFFSNNPREAEKSFQDTRITVLPVSGEVDALWPMEENPHVGCVSNGSGCQNQWDTTLG